MAVASQVVPAGPGDHPLIRRLLLLAGQTASAAEFHLRLEEPDYAPAQRLVLRHSGDIVGHVQSTPRTLQFGGQTLPVVWLRDLVVLPEFRSLGLAEQLLLAAQEQARASSALLMLWETKAPVLAARHGWQPLGASARREARPRDILANLPLVARHEPLLFEAWRPIAPAISIRCWRHYERAALVGLFDQRLRSTVGPFARDDERWRWLISRGAYDQIYVAIAGPDSWELTDVHPQIVGYAVIRGADILELAAAPERPNVAHQLLARACGDAIEQDLFRVALHAPPDDPLAALFSSQANAEPTCWHAQPLAPLGLLEILLTALHVRWRSEGLSATDEFGLCIDGQKLRLVATRRSLKLLPGKLGRAQLKVDAATLGKLLLGATNIDAEIQKGAVIVSNAAALSLAAALFPPLPWWLPPWEALAAKA
jgi:predicted N-acetyltransferase YhbS